MEGTVESAKRVKELGLIIKTYEYMREKRNWKKKEVVEREKITARTGGIRGVQEEGFC